MRITKIKGTVPMSFLLFAGLIAYSQTANAGDLEPTAPPAPTMKTLEEVEARTPINAEDLPLTISGSGSYYLVEDISFSTSGVNGITITADDVTVDLNGFKLDGPGMGTTGNGITNPISGDISGAVVVNGTISNWRHGVSLEGTGNKVREVTVRNNTGYGIVVGNQSLVSGCFAFNNGDAGVAAGSDSMVRDCVSRDNEIFRVSLWYGNGIEVEQGCTVMGCRVSSNKVNGISADDDSIVMNCTASHNEGNGIFIRSGRVVNCTAAHNDTQGIQAEDGSLITDNLLDRNDIGIRLDGEGSVIRANHFTLNATTGLNVFSENNYSAQNTFHENGTDINGAHKQGTGEMANIMIP